MVKVSNECKILCVFKNVTLSKNIVFSFKSVDTNADLLLRSGEKGPYCSYEEGQRNLISSPVMGRFCGRELCLWSGVPPSSAKLPYFSILLIYILYYFCAIEFNTCSSPYNQTLIY